MERINTPWKTDSARNPALKPSLKSHKSFLKIQAFMEFIIFLSFPLRVSKGLAPLNGEIVAYEGFPPAGV